MRIFRSDLPAIGAVAVVLVLSSAALLRAQVSCADPDNLCTGDPCIIAVATEVQCPCVVDFSPRALIVDAPLDLPDACVVEFTAGAIEVRGRIDGRHKGGGNGSGATLGLIAAGNIDLSGRIDVSGDLQAGTITVDAGGNIVLRGSLNSKAVGRNATTGGGSVTVEAGDTLTTERRGFVDVRGQKNTTPGGIAILRGAAGVVAGGKVDASGFFGGMIEVSSSGGDVTIEKKLWAKGKPGNGGTVNVIAQNTVTVSANIKAETRESAMGGQIIVESSGGDVVMNRSRSLRVRSSKGAGGAAVVRALAGTALIGDVDARGETVGGFITVEGSVITIGGNLLAGTKVGDGGNVSLQGGNVNVQWGKVEVDSRSGIAGTITVNGNNITLSGSRFDADGGSGTICFKSDPGNMTLDGDFRALNGGGVIEGHAVGDLTALGLFRAAPGCIGFSAGGTLLTPGSFDEPVLPGCGVCPTP